MAGRGDVEGKNVQYEEQGLRLNWAPADVFVEGLWPIVQLESFVKAVWVCFLARIEHMVLLVCHHNWRPWRQL